MGGGLAGTGPPPTRVCPTVLAYMQLLEDYSEPQPSVFYQTPQKEHIYQQKNRLLMEVYGFNDSFSAGDAPHELAPPPALPPKQRQLVSGPLPGAPLPTTRRQVPIAMGGCLGAGAIPGQVPALAVASPQPKGGGVLLFQSSPSSWDWLRCRTFAFSVGSLFSLSSGSKADLPEWRDSISAQGPVCVWPSGDWIYITGPECLPPQPGPGRPVRSRSRPAFDRAALCFRRRAPFLPKTPPV